MKYIEGMKGQDEGGRKGSRRRSGWPFSTIRSDSPKAAPPTVIGANPQSCSGDLLALDQVDLPRTRVIQISARYSDFGAFSLGSRPVARRPFNSHQKSSALIDFVLKLILSEK